VAEYSAPTRILPLPVGACTPNQKAQFTAGGRILGTHTVPVVMPGVVGERYPQVAFSEDQHSVGAFAAGGAHPAFARGACGGVLVILMPVEVNTSSNPAVNLLSRSRM